MPPYAPSIELSALDGTDGFRIPGVEPVDFSGSSVASAGDVNGDGFADIIIGAHYADPPGDNAGSAYVVFGTSAGFAADFDLSSLDGTNGFELTGLHDQDRTGHSVASAGDINGDGIDDIIVGAHYSGGMGRGLSYVVFGKTTGFAANVDLPLLNGTDGFSISGEGAIDHSGFSVASAGDVNGDGFGDLIIGSPLAYANGLRSGTTHVVFGKATGFTSNLTLSALNGTNGFQISGGADGDNSGYSVASAGDVNGDGFDDLIVGAKFASPHGVSSGASYVVFGKASGFAANIDLTSLNGTTGFKLSGTADYDYSGVSVASAGDINGDGFDDVIVGAPEAGISGASYVVFGKAAGFVANIDLSSLDGVGGFEIGNDGPTEGSIGFSVASAGDFNGDGFDDLIVGAPASNHGGGARSGATWVVFGKASGFTGNLDLSSLDGSDGFEINGESSYDESGHSVASAGDVNGDGFDDLIVGAWKTFQAGGEYEGASYVVFGGEPGEAVTRIGTDIAQTIRGGDFNDRLEGLGGDDLLFGDKGKDRLLGGSGDDTLTGGRGRDRLDGGLGDDTFVFSALNESGTTATKRDSIEGFVRGEDSIDLSGIDAVPGGTDQAFIFVKNATGPGQVEVDRLTPTSALVLVYVDADAIADLTIEVLGPTRLNAGDFDL